MMSADATLCLMEKHVHEAEMTFSEGRLMLAKNGFCDQHPYIQLRKKKWLGFREKVIMKTCPRCDEEHVLKMQAYRLRLQAYQQTLMGSTAASPSAVPQPTWATGSLPAPASTSRVPLLCQPVQQQQQQQPPVQAAQLQDTASASQPLAPPQQEIAKAETAKGRLAYLVAANPTRKFKQGTSRQNLAALQISAPRLSLPRRASSCKAQLCEIPEDMQEEEYIVEIPDASVGSPNSSPSIRISDLSVTPSEPQEKAQLRASNEDVLPCYVTPEEPMKDSMKGQSTASLSSEPSPEVAVVRREEGNAKAYSKTDEEIKEQEKRRKGVGALARPGNGDTLREMTEFAKYGMGSCTDVQGPATDSPSSPTTVKDCLEEEEAISDPVKDCVNALKCWCKRPQETQQVLHELQALCQASEKHQMTVVMGDGLQAVLQSMKAFSNHAGVQEEACWVLGTLACNNDDHKSLIAEGGGIVAIVSSMQTLIAHAEFQETACEVIAYLTEGHLLNKIAVCESGGLEAITAAMEYHLGCASVQERLCLVLGDLAQEGGPAGGVASIFAAMIEHKFNAKVQASACVALGNLAAQNETAKFLIAEGVRIILATLRNHGPSAHNSRDTEVQEMACFALQSVAHGSPENKDLMLERGILPELLAILKNSKTGSKAVEAVCDTLIVLVQYHSSAKDSLVNLGGIRLMVSIVKNTSQYASVQRAACRVLTNLSHNHDRNKRLIVVGGGIAAIIFCMMDRAANPDLLQYACKTLTSLTVNDDNKVALADAMGIESVVTALRNHPSHAGVQESGCGVLLNMARCDGLQERMVESDGLVALLAAMKHHKGNVTIQEKACGVLRELAISDTNEIAIARAGGIDAILAALKRHGRHRGLFRNACGALRNLSFHDESCKLKIANTIGFGPLFTDIESFLRGEDTRSDSSSQGSTLSSS